MAALAIDEYTDTPDELLKRAQRINEQQVIDFSEVPSMLLAAVNKKLAEIAPDEEPYAAAKRLSVEWDKWAIESGYDLLLWYYKDSLNLEKFSVSYEQIDHELYTGIAEDMFRMLKNGNA